MDPARILAVAPDVTAFALAPRRALNAYRVGDVLVDAGLPGSAKALGPQLAGTGLRALALTHAHGDHAGAATRLVESLGLELWVGAADAEAARTGEPAIARSPLRPLLAFAGSFDGVDVDRELREGDELGAGFVVLDAPGPSPGHLAFWREADRVLVAGDVWLGLSPWTTRPALREPPRALTPDPAVNRDAIRRLTALEPDLLLPGHGPPVRDAAPRLRAFAKRLG